MQAAFEPSCPCLRVLLVEDTPERQTILKTLYRAHAWVLVETGQRAVTLLSAFEFDMVSLDYNLRGELTGADVAQAIAAGANRNARVIVHSLNLRGVEKITAILPDAVLYPVSKMTRSNAVFKRLQHGLNTAGVDYDWEQS